MLFDPLEKQLDLPAATIKPCDGERRQGEVVGEKDQSLLGLGIFESYPSERLIEALARIEDGECDALVANKTGGFVDFVGVAALDLEIGLGPRDKEAARLAQSTQPFEVDVSAIHDIEGAGFGQKLIQNIDLVEFPIADGEERRDVASEVQQCVQFDGSLGRTERSPREHRQAQIDGGSVQSVNGLPQIDPEGFVGIEAACYRDETLSEIAVDAPIAHRVGVGQSVARRSRTNPQVVELGGLRAQTRFDVAQAFSKRELSKGHR